MTFFGRMFNQKLSATPSTKSLCEPLLDQKEELLRQKEKIQAAMKASQENVRNHISAVLQEVKMQADLQKKMQQINASLHKIEKKDRRQCRIPIGADKNRKSSRDGKH